MLTLQTAAARLRRELATAEATSDSLLLKLGAIQSTVLTARNDIDLAAHTCQEALLKLQRAMTHAISAQTELFRAHEALAKVGREMMGGEEEYTPSTGLADDAAKLPFAEAA